MPDLLSEITQAARAYYRQTTHIQLTATDFLEWVAQLGPTAQADLLARGFARGQTELAFLRYCLEVRAYPMRAHMLEHLSCAAFELWQANAQFNGDLPDHLAPL